MHRHVEENRGEAMQREQLIERGRQLHSQAVFDIFAWLLTLRPGRSRSESCAGYLEEHFEPHNHPA